VVLDGEKDKAVGIFLEKRLVCLLLLDSWRDTSLCDRRIFWEIWDADDGPENLSADEKSSFFAGESVILSASIAIVAWLRVSIDAYIKKCASWTDGVPAWKALTEEQTLCD
jgi:hypothetical protein